MDEYQLTKAIKSYVADNFGESEADDPSWSIEPLAAHLAEAIKTEQQHNGWSNYATWRVMLELMSEYIDYEIERIREGDTELLDMSDGDLARYLKEYAEEQAESAIADTGDVMAGIVQGWANAFLEDVNWYEVAQNAKETWQAEKESK